MEWYSYLIGVLGVAVGLFMIIEKDGTIRVLGLAGLTTGILILMGYK